MKKWLKQKTTKLGIGIILGSIAGVLTGSVETTQAIYGCITGLLGLFAGDHNQGQPPATN